MNRLRSTASTISKIGLSIAALLVLCPAASAEDAGVFTNDNSALQVRFYDNSPYAQVSRIRSLSFLTLTNSGKSRWFLGINSDGIFGLHYRATAPHKSEVSADIVRQQYVDRYRTLDTY